MCFLDVFALLLLENVQHDKSNQNEEMKQMSSSLATVRSDLETVQQDHTKKNEEVKQMSNSLVTLRRDLETQTERLKELQNKTVQKYNNCKRWKQR